MTRLFPHLAALGTRKSSGRCAHFWSNLGPFLNSQTEAPHPFPHPSPHPPDWLPCEGPGVAFSGLGFQEPKAFLKPVPKCLRWVVWEIKAIYSTVRSQSFFPLRHDGCSQRSVGWLELASSVICMNDEMLFSIWGGPFKLAPLNLKAKGRACFQVKWGLSSMGHPTYRHFLYLSKRVA